MIFILSKLSLLELLGPHKLGLLELLEVSSDSGFTFIDLFAGIGGFHIAASSHGGSCVFTSEIDKYARMTYETNFRESSPALFSNGGGLFNSDITEVDLESIPDFDVLCGGFPCQSFSIIGKQLGFDDTRGTLFFNIKEIIEAKIAKGSPAKVLLLENVKGLLSHDKGNTFRVIEKTLRDLGYEVAVDVLNSRYFGLPQNRERVFIVAWYKGRIDAESFKFPQGLDNQSHFIYDKEGLKSKVVATCLDSILLSDDELGVIEEREGISTTLLDGTWVWLNQHKDRNRKKGNGFGYVLLERDAPYTGALLARYYKDGSEILINQAHLGKNPRKLHPIEAARLQGFPVDAGYSFPVSRSQAYKQLGNSVSIPVIKALIKEIKDTLLSKG